MLLAENSICEELEVRSYKGRAMGPGEMCAHATEGRGELL